MVQVPTGIDEELVRQFVVHEMEQYEYQCSGKYACPASSGKPGESECKKA